MWIARDYNGMLKLYNAMPIACDFKFEPGNIEDDNNCLELPHTWFDDVCWENSPIEVELQIKDNYVDSKG